MSPPKLIVAVLGAFTLALSMMGMERSHEYFLDLLGVGGNRQNGKTANKQGDQRHQLSSTLASGNSGIIKHDIVDYAVRNGTIDRIPLMPLKSIPVQRSNLHGKTVSRLRATTHALNTATAAADYDSNKNITSPAAQLFTVTKTSTTTASADTTTEGTANTDSESKNTGDTAQTVTTSAASTPAATAMARNGNTILSNADDYDHSDTFSACLLWMDDNHRLVEWVAYHYYAIQLRHLVVAVDPHSKTSPATVLERWKDYGMTVEIWTNDTFTDKDLIIRPEDDGRKRTWKHRQRQGLFYQACVRHLQTFPNRTWTAFHDVDEYLTVNGDTVTGAEEMVQQPGSVLRVVKTYSAKIPKDEREKNVPSNWYDQFSAKPCVTIARIMVGATESNDTEIAIDGIPPSVVDPRQFDTLQWRYRTSKRGNHDGPAKSIIDVSRVGPNDFGGFSAHKPLRRICPSAFIGYNQSPLGIYHYIGSWESYSFREDARDGIHHTIERWKFNALKTKGGTDEHMRHWIKGFVKMVGIEDAKMLLKDAGLPQGYRHNSTLNLMLLEQEMKLNQTLVPK